jgi:hypothetical protein
VPVDAAAAAGATGAWALVAGSTNPMQTRLSNAELRLRYADGSADTLELVPPLNFWALSGWGNVSSGAGAAPRSATRTRMHAASLTPTAPAARRPRAE